jgi:serine/threonine-protein kinase
MAEHQKYRITERIDAGGMAEVFRGVAESLQGFKKSVAIKRILPHLCKNKKFISMFLDEARLSLYLQHANIVGVFDIGMSSPDQTGGGGAYFIVMEYVDGLHLKGIIESLRRQGKRLTVAQVLYLCMEVCKGLAYAHDITDPETGRPLGIVHRDISPPNILISKNGEVKLVDFGLAKATSQIESTDPGVVKGKFSYLSPEAATGKEVDRRADIFAVGILLYEMLTGKRLFYGENDHQTVELVRQSRIPSIAQQNPEVEPELEQVVRKALARDLNQRYQTAFELQDAIAHYLFSRGLKVTSRDIAQLVRSCLAERQKNQPALPPAKSLIDTLIQEELIKFTSLEAGGEGDGTSSGAQPLSPEELGRPAPPDGGGEGALINTLNWTEELAEPSTPRLGGVIQNGQAGQARAAAAPPPPRPTASRNAMAPAAAMDGARPASVDVDLADMLEGQRGGMARQSAAGARAEIPRPAPQPPVAPPSATARIPRWVTALLVALAIVGGGALILLVKTVAARH